MFRAGFWIGTRYFSFWIGRQAPGMQEGLLLVSMTPDLRETIVRYRFVGSFSFLMVSG